MLLTGGCYLNDTVYSTGEEEAAGAGTGRDSSVDNVCLATRMMD